MKKSKAKYKGFSGDKDRSSKKSLINSNEDLNKIEKSIILINQGNLSEAEEIYKELISNGTKNHIVYGNLAVLYGVKGQYNEMIELLEHSLKIQPNHPESYSNLGNAYKARGELTKAISYYEKALNLNPNHAETHNNIGIALQNQGNLLSAIKHCRKAITIKPNFAEAYNNLGNALKENGDLADSIRCFQQAIRLKSNYAEAYWNLSNVQLLNGDYSSGWKNYEWRWKLIDVKKPHASAKIPKWNGLIRPKEKILVISEQGIGDTIQYMRYIPYLRSQDLDVAFCAQEKLHSLIKASGIDVNPLTPEQVQSISIGKWVPLLSLPKYLGVESNNPLISHSYIYSTTKLIRKWKDILQSEKKPIIGINWQGNPEMERSAYQGRSIKLNTFSKLLDENAITLLSLQKGYGSEQFDACSFKNNFVKCQKEIDHIWDFSENAAIIANCDLIITCDTSIAHLAGGMGVKVWLLLKDIPYWTWGMTNSTTMWYPSMKLFRQKEKHNWDEVMKRVSSNLKKTFKLEHLNS